MTRYLFLDFDGVLNSHVFFEQRKATGAKGRGGLEIDPSALDKIKSLVVDNNLCVVVSSSWRYDMTLLEMEEMLGFHVHSVIPILSGFQDDGTFKYVERGEEIKTWMNDNAKPEDIFLIIDDVVGEIAGHFDDEKYDDICYIIETTFTYGFIKKHFDEATYYLNMD